MKKHIDTTVDFDRAVCRRFLTKNIDAAV